MFVGLRFLAATLAKKMLFEALPVSPNVLFPHNGLNQTKLAKYLELR